MNISQIGPMQQYELIGRMAKAIANVEGYNFGDVDMCKYAEINPRAAHYVLAAEAALEKVKEFGTR